MHHTLLFLTASQQICGCVTAVELFVCVSLQMVVLLLPDLHAELSTSKLVLPYLQVVRCSPRHPSLHQINGDQQQNITSWQAMKWRKSESN